MARAFVHYQFTRPAPTLHLQEPSGTKLETKRFVGIKGIIETARFPEPSGTNLGSKHLNGEHHVILTKRMSAH